MSARNFQITTGMEKFLDQGALGTKRIEPDGFYYDAALRMIGSVFINRSNSFRSTPSSAA